MCTVGGWTRGDASDYNAWAHDVNDNRWSYDGMLPYFKRSETHHDPSADPAHHGFNGPVHTASLTSSGRRFPLREPVRRIFEEALGLEFRSDLNDGETRGISDLVENWKDGKRQIASAVYPLDGVSVLTNTVVKRVILSTANVATGVELASGETLALKEGGQVIVSAGAYRTPQVLMLSGIGDAKHLAEHGIKCKMNSPDVGRNLHDHVLLYRYWTLLHPERGLALGHANFTGENYDKGGPLDFLARTGLPAKGLTAALQKDGVEDAHDLVGRTHLELGIPYAPLGAETVGLNVPFDGTTIATFAMSCLPTSRGTITLHSPSPNDAPIIDPNYTSTHFDRQVLREAFRILGKLALDTRDGKDVIAGEHTPAGFPVLGLDASDEDVDERVRFGAGTTYHAAGSAAMGRVVDGGLKVVGVEGVRVVDASVVSVRMIHVEERLDWMVVVFVGLS